MNMDCHTKAKNKLEGDTNFRAWKTRIDLVLVKEGPQGVVKGKVTKLEKYEDKAKFERMISQP